MSFIDRLGKLFSSKQPDLVLRSEHDEVVSILDVSTGNTSHYPGVPHFYIDDEEVDVETYMRIGLKRAPANKNYYEVPRG